MEQKKKIIMGSDHGGFRLKEFLKKHLQNLNNEIDDAGCYSEESCDYPVIGQKVAQKVAEGEGIGILICGTGLGMSMVANQIPGVRAALCHTAFEAEMSRRHNNSNIIVLGGRVTGENLAQFILDVWLKTDFDGGRHQKRLDMFNSIKC